jgi:NAD(P)-dependent dehydrogenase (short-subunit alcohol dehydrogenase family)
MKDQKDHMVEGAEKVALVTGGSRGIGAATAVALARSGYHVAISYRNKAARAQAVAEEVQAHGVQALAAASDITQQDDVARLFASLRAWKGHIDLLVLNASGGLERDLVAADPAYPQRINRDAQLALLEGALPLMPRGSTVVFVTSHWAHLYGQIEQLPSYGPIAQSKWEGEQALRQTSPALRAAGIRLLVVTGDLIEGTITPRLLERAAPGLTAMRRETAGALPSAAEMGEAIAAAALNPSLPFGHLVVVGGPLHSVVEETRQAD